MSLGRTLRRMHPVNARGAAQKRARRPDQTKAGQVTLTTEGPCRISSGAAGDALLEHSSTCSIVKILVNNACLAPQCSQPVVPTQMSATPWSPAGGPQPHGRLQATLWTITLTHLPVAIGP